MISTVINSLRVFKGLYDFAFSEKQFYVDSRAALKDGIGYSIEQFKEGYNNPKPGSEKPALIRGPFKIMLLILGIILTIAVMFGGRLIEKPPDESGGFIRSIPLRRTLTGIRLGIFSIIRALVNLWVTSPKAASGSHDESSQRLFPCCRSGSYPLESGRKIDHFYGYSASFVKVDYFGFAWEPTFE